MTIPRILHINNQFESKKRLTLLLTEADCEVIPASTIKQALGMLRVTSPHLILCKMRLPDGEADTFIQSLKASGEYGDIPVVVMAAETDRSRESKVLKLGASTVLHLNDADAFIVSTLKEIADLNVSSAAEDSVSITGQLARLDIFELIREMAKEHGSGIISIDGSERMEIQLDQGNVVRARHGITIGKKALFRCLRVAEAAYHFTPQHFDGEPEISDELDALIGEARESNQKLMANSHLFPLAHHRLKINYTDELKHAKLRPEARAAIEVIKRYPVVKEYLNHLNLPDTMCYEYLLSFKERGFIDISTDRRPICIMTDSSCDLGPGVLQLNKIDVVPMKLRFDEDTDIVDAPQNVDDLFNINNKSMASATVTPVSENAFLTRNMARVGSDDCLTILPSTRLIPEHQNEIRDLQKLIRFGYEGRPLMTNELLFLETKSFSLGLGLLVLRAAGFREQGLTIESIRHRLKQLQRRLHVFVAVNESQSLLTAKGNGKQVLRWHDGAFHTIAAASEIESVQTCFLDQIEDLSDSESNLHIAIGHVNNQWDAAKLGDFLEQSKPLAHISTYPLGPITARHLGKGALEVAFLQE